MKDAYQLIQHGIAAYRAQHREVAREYFQEALDINPKLEIAWLWLASVVNDDHEKRFCLRRALEINPRSKPAERGMEKLNKEIAERKMVAAPGEASQSMNTYLPELLASLQGIRTELQALRLEMQRRDRREPLEEVEPALSDDVTKKEISPTGDAVSLNVASYPVIDHPVANWLRARNIVVRAMRQQDSRDATFDKLSNSLGERYAVLSPLYKAIKSRVSSGTKFTINIGRKSPNEISVFCNDSDASLRLRSSSIRGFL